MSHVQVVDPYTPEPVSDAELIDRVLAGDPRAERALYDAHVDRVFRLVYRMAGDLDRAQDWVQETFIRAFEKLGDFRGESALSTWLCSIAMSVSLNGLRKAKRFRERETSLEDAAPLGFTPREADPDLKARLTQAIEDLPDGYRAVFVMHDVEGYKHEEIAGMLFYEVPIRPDYVMFEIPDEFVVGYGLDYEDRFRNLPYVAALEPEDLA